MCRFPRIQCRSFGLNVKAQVGAALVDHFGWFLRSLYHCCETSEGDAWESQRFFVHYLAHNRYRRLAEVGLFLMQGELNVAEKSESPKAIRDKQAELESTAASVCALLHRQRGDVAAADLDAIVKRWSRLLYAPLPTAR